MKTLESIEVTVTYSVGLGGVEIPDKVLKQLKDAHMRSRAIDIHDHSYPDLGSWLADNIQERDCMDWKCEVSDYSI